MDNVFIVLSYGNIVGVYSSQEDAAFVQRERIQKNQPADIYCRPIIHPKNLKS